jgi:coatomer protein complex subunit gamma
MTFLSNVLREEGGFPYKKAIVDTILVIIDKVPESKEAGLGHLCEFIEDCEFTLLSTQILYLLGVEGPGTQDPAKYIRFIYNRVVLENATVRASAVSALAKFGLQLEELRESITVLLQRCLYDNDDEVRDRATFFVAMLTGRSGATDPKKLLEPLQVPLGSLEHCCKEYMANPSEAPFTLGSVTVDPETLKRERQAAQQKEEARGGGETLSSPARPVAAAAAARAAESEADLLSKLPQFVHIGARFNSAKKVALSEAGTEYEVTCLKHVYASHILLQFQLNNTLEDQLLEDVTVSLDLSTIGGGLALDSELKCARLPFGAPADCFVCLRRVEGVPVGSIPATLKFLVKDVDPAKGEPEEDETGYDDEYMLEELEIAAADFVKKVSVVDFKEAWSTIGTDCEVVETFSLSYSSLKQAMDAVIDYLGLQPCDNSANPAEGARTHTVMLSGLFLGGVQVFAIVNLRVDSPKAVGMRLMVRSTDMGISQFVAASVA